MEAHGRHQTSCILEEVQVKGRRGKCYRLAHVQQDSLWLGVEWTSGSAATIISWYDYEFLKPSIDTTSNALLSHNVSSGNSTDALQLHDNLFSSRCPRSRTIAERWFFLQFTNWLIGALLMRTRKTTMSRVQECLASTEYQQEWPIDDIRPTANKWVTQASLE